LQTYNFIIILKPTGYHILAPPTETTTSGTTDLTALEFSEQTSTKPFLRKGTSTISSLTEVTSTEMIQCIPHFLYMIIHFHFQITQNRWRARCSSTENTNPRTAPWQAFERNVRAFRSVSSSMKTLHRKRVEAHALYTTTPAAATTEVNPSLRMFCSCTCIYILKNDNISHNYSKISP